MPGVTRLFPCPSSSLHGRVQPGLALSPMGREGPTRTRAPPQPQTRAQPGGKHRALPGRRAPRALCSGWPPSQRPLLVLPGSQLLHFDSGWGTSRAGLAIHDVSVTATRPGSLSHHAPGESPFPVHAIFPCKGKTLSSHRDCAPLPSEWEAPQHVGPARSAAEGSQGLSLKESRPGYSPPRPSALALPVHTLTPGPIAALQSRSLGGVGPGRGEPFSG